jgi:hypothetical protein
MAGISGGLGARSESDPQEGDDAERQANADWNREQLGERRHLKGMLRHVYPWNFFSEVHLASRCGSQSFQEWILADKHRGSLEALGTDQYCWSFPVAHFHVIRGELARFGMLICR